MELKEAIERLEKYLSDIKKMGFRKLPNDEAIDTVLQALDNSITKDKIKEKIEEQTKRIDKLLEDVVDKSTGCINVSYLSKKEKEEIINKRNCLLVQKATLQQMGEELLKGE